MQSDNGLVIARSTQKPEPSQRMNPSRRLFLRRLFLGGLGAGLAGKALMPLQASATPPAAGIAGEAPLADALAHHRPTLTALLDTLLPDDGVTPSASALGVDDDLHDFLLALPEVHEPVLAVFDWLDTVGDRRYFRLSAPLQLHLVDLMAGVAPDMLEGWFYQSIRRAAIEFYYTKPEALVGLDLDAAPQPAGYMPPWGA